MGISKFTNMHNKFNLRNEVTINSNSVTLIAFDSNNFQITLINFAFRQCSSSNPYFLPANTSCLAACPSNCDVNNTASFLCAPCNITSCPNGSYLSNNTCLPCDSTCLICGSLSNCTTCSTNFSL